MGLVDDPTRVSQRPVQKTLQLIQEIPLMGEIPVEGRIVSQSPDVSYFLSI